MGKLALTVVHWLHLAASVVWIGGIAFILLVALPSCKQVLGAEAGRVMSEMSKRFTLLANWSIALLIVTGIVLTGADKGGGGWAASLVAKHVLFVVMVAVHFYRGLFLAPRIARSADTERSSLQKFSLDLVKVNLGLSLAVLLLS